MKRPAPMGLLLRLRPFNESDLLLDFFSDQHGRLTALAKGARRSKRRFMGLLLSAHLLALELKPVKKSDLWVLESAQLLSNYLGLSQDYQRWLASGPILEMLLKGTAYSQPAPELLYLALLTLKRIERSHNSLERRTALLIFINRFLKEVGFALYLARCLKCGLEQFPAGLSLQGGVICCQCLPGQNPVSRGLINSLLAGQTLAMDGLSRLSFTQNALNEGLPFVSAFARQILGNDLLSLDFIEHA